MKQQTVVGFDFQVIPLEEAQRIILAGSGNYAALKEKVLEELPKLGPNDGFAFGLPKGRLSPIQIRGISMSLNNVLKRAGHQWKVNYSEGKNLFVVAPKTNGKHPVKLVSRQKPASLPSDESAKMDELITKAEKVFQVRRELLVRPTHSMETSACRKAIQHIALKTLGLKARNIAAAMGVTKDAIWQAVNKSEAPKEHIANLEAAIQ